MPCGRTEKFQDLERGGADSEVDEGLFLNLLHKLASFAEIAPIALVNGPVNKESNSAM